PNIRPGSPLAEVIRLADSGVDEGLMLAFIANSAGTFNLGSVEIIYLKDIGVPPNVVTAMLQRDQALKEVSTSLAQGPTVAAVPNEPLPALDAATAYSMPAVAIAPVIESAP